MLMAAILAIGFSCDNSSGKKTDSGADRGPADAGSGDGAGAVGFDGDRRQPLTPADDVQFIDFFVPHHQAAIEMASMEIDNGADPAVKAMAAQMKTSQMEEIAMLREARRALTAVAESPAPPEDTHMSADMAVMKSVSGTQLDKLFLEEMIPHHAGALPVAHRATTTLSRSDLRTMAVAIYDAQAREIGDMKLMLGEPTGGGATVATTVGGAADGGSGFTAVDTSVRGDRRLPYTPADDLAFIDFFVSHHQMAIEMANMIVERGQRADVKTLAQSIKDAQTNEIAQMRSARQALTNVADSPAAPPDSHMMADQAAMMALSGEALDRHFLEEMIPHHAAGVPVAHRGRPRLQRADMKELALKIFAAQAREIGEMHTMWRQGQDGGAPDAMPGN